MPTDPTPARRIFWTCIHEGCGHSFRSYTRKGERITCPKCHRVQPGPAGVRAQLKRLEELELQLKGRSANGNGKSHENGRAASEVKIVGTAKPTPKPATASPPPPAATPEPVAATTTGPGIFDRVFFGGRGE